jgi:hypothetical protein
MSDDVLRIDPIFCLEHSYETLDCNQLCRGWMFFFKVAYQHDSNSPLIVVAHAGMGAVHLLPPAKCLFYLSIRHAVSVTDDKMVSDSQPGIAAIVFSFQVSFVNAFDAAARRRRVMDNNVLPIACGPLRLPEISLCRGNLQHGKLWLGVDWLIE